MNATSSPAMRHVLSAGLLSLLFPSLVRAAPPLPAPQPQSRCTDTSTPAAQAPIAADPYPVMAAGWGPELGGGLMASRWAEDWSGMRAAGDAPAFKAIPLGDASLTLSSEFRLRYVSAGNAQLVRGKDFGQAQLRAVVGAQLRLAPRLRVYGELGTGRVEEGQGPGTANFRNAVSLQQLFVDARGMAGDAMVGAMLGRQEFSDGPRQLISLSDGPNLHRTWNGVRLYAHGAHYRLGAFDLRATRLGRGGFDERVDDATTLQGVLASVIVSREGGPNTYLDPFWFHTRSAAVRLGGRVGPDTRDTFGARLWGRVGRARFDWTVARQTGRSGGGRPVDAWGVFAVQSLALADTGWSPRLTSHIDVASGGGTYGEGAVRVFNPLYASSNYLGEGQFLGLGNLVLVAPGIAVSPSPRTTLSLEFAHARRLRPDDAVYAGGMRAYAGTEQVAGRNAGNLVRLAGSWNATPRLTLSATFEHFAAGSVLERAGYPSGHHGYFSATYRY